MKNDIAISKQNPQGVEVFRYEGKVLKRSAGEILIEARFGLQGRSLLDIPLDLGDRFLETYFSDHWYNIYEIRGRDDDRLKGWYCNVTYPPEISESLIAFRDLALDLAVYPDGRQVVLDEDEFQALGLPPDIQQKALGGLRELQRIFTERF
ncbi:MAG: DUF402 domain-containing protein [Anaerolineales bacterium]